MRSSHLPDRFPRRDFLPIFRNFGLYQYKIGPGPLNWPLLQVRNLERIAGAGVISETVSPSMARQPIWKRARAISEAGLDSFQIVIAKPFRQSSIKPREFKKMRTLRNDGAMGGCYDRCDLADIQGIQEIQEIQALSGLFPEDPLFKPI
jgi:hypothetical protein